MEMVTRDEKEALEARLAALIANRPLISRRIAEARELGDLKENAEYHAAREEQGHQEMQIKTLEKRLANIQVVGDAHKNSGVVYIGAMVKIVEVGKSSIEIVRLVGEATGENAGGDEDIIEATVNSPFGAALDKARVGDIIDVRGPRGVKKFEIKEII